MDIQIPNSNQLTKTNDIVVGYGVIPALLTSKKPTTWVLPGFNLTTDSDLAIKSAKRIDELIQSNLKKQNKSSLY